MNEQDALLKELIANYAKAVNSGDIEGLLSLYAEDALFMPDGVRTLKKGQIGRSGLEQFSRKAFEIEFFDIKIEVHGSTAFAEAVAKTAASRPDSASRLEATSRDLFVFRHENGRWKIIRYIFNSVKVSSAENS